ncbi:hypothetical protein [Fusobacterium sp.]|uniref:hypothetical protein n=1 Tax=Fusobacterium sp. TaxID=68766 RepID=UPI002900C48F|nr:hypothetical protein [Fusobacterium sp.]MDU1910462.1 hypothetical protein [Fusobacterium sp.]
MKRTVIILSALMVMVYSNGVIYAEAGDGKPLEMSKIEVKAQEKTEKFKIATKKTENKQTAAHIHSQERSEER